MSESAIFSPDLLRDQVCVVSGGGTGLGKAAALELARLGATVEICGRRPDPLDGTVAEAKAASATMTATPMDIRDEEAVD